MLSGVPSKWPRVFSAIGFGSIFIIIVISTMLKRVIASDAPSIRQQISDQRRDLIDAQQFAADPNSGLSSEQQAEMLADISMLEVSVAKTEDMLEVISEKTIFDLMSEMITEMQETQLFLLGLFGLFICFVCGEICLAFGKMLCTGLRHDQVVWAKRTASVAKLENSLVTTEYQAQQSLLTILFGFAAVIVFAAIFDLYASSLPMPDLWTAFAALSTIFVVPFAGHRIARHIGHEIDLTLDAMDQGPHSDEAQHKYEKTTEQSAVK